MQLTYSRRQSLNKLGLTICVFLLVAFVAFPLVWMFTSSLKGPAEMFSATPSLIPHHVTLENYKTLLDHTNFRRWFLNTIIIAIGNISLVVAVATLGAYSLCRFQYPGRRLVSISILFTYFFPPVLMLVPIFLILLKLHLLNTYFGLILANSTFGLPFAVWFLRSFFESMPIQIEEAAMIDGAARVRVLFDVVLPQALPGIIAVSIFSFITSWNEYLFASTIMSTDVNKTLSPGIANLANSNDILWGPLMAASVLVTVPILVFFIFLQQRLVGSVRSGVKG